MKSELTGLGALPNDEQVLQCIQTVSWCEGPRYAMISGAKDARQAGKGAHMPEST